jgi:DNA helicase HerA-like ATPase
MLYTEDGRPRHNIFYLAHLSDEERMFFITLLLSAVETWMRTQSGATTLRALLYMDEISGYLPPLRNPPSKSSLLRMLKNARAFGLGLLLATQNPVDLDLKADYSMD